MTSTVPALSVRMYWLLNAIALDPKSTVDTPKVSALEPPPVAAIHRQGREDERHRDDGSAGRSRQALSYVQAHRRWLVQLVTGTPNTISKFS